MLVATSKIPDQPEGYQRKEGEEISKERPYQVTLISESVEY